MENSFKELLKLRWTVVPYWKRVTAILIAAMMIWFILHSLAGWKPRIDDSMLITAAKELITQAADWLQWLLPGVMALSCICREEKDQ